MDAFTLRSPSGARRLVLRRYLPNASPDTRAQAERHWRMLAALAQIGLRAPRPVWFDPDGAFFGTPALVMTRIAGRPDLFGADIDAWADQLAAALVRIHQAPLDAADLSFLPTPSDFLTDRLQHGPHNDVVLTHPLGATVLSALWSWIPRLRPAPAGLVHGDYWAGNTLSRRGHIVAVVDWDDATLAEPGLDVGYCRMDLAMLHGSEVAERFLRAYERHAGQRVPNLAAWDLRGALAALPNPERWLTGYHALGRTDITPDQMRRRLHVFILDALRRGAEC